MLVFAVVWQFSAGVLDRCDGEVARIRNYESEAGARFDMLIDDLRFALPFVFLTIACYRESHRDLYLVVAVATAAWYSTAVVYHNRFLRRAGYVSIQTMGVDFFKAGGDPLVRCVSENSAVYERRHSYVLYLSGKLPAQQIGPLLDAGCLCVAVGSVVFFYHCKISSAVHQRTSQHRLKRLLSDRDRTHYGLARQTS